MSPETARIYPLLDKDKSNGEGMLKEIDSTKTLYGICRTHSTKSIIRSQWWPEEETDDLSGHIFFPKKVRRAVESFHSFQSAGEDEMFLALLQRELDNIMETHSTFSEPVLLGADDQAKLYRPISHFFS